MKINSQKKCIWVSLLALFICHLAGETSFAQQTKEKEDEKAFFNLGYVSYSPNYALSQDGRFITFKVRNNTSRPITNIFAWVYRSGEEKEGETSGFLLVNNPNKGGILVKGGLHPSGEIAEWRFSFTRVKNTTDPTEKYSLRVSPKSIFFGDKTLK